MLVIEEKVLQAVKNAAKEGRLSCEEAHRLAGELDVPLRLVGEACDKLKIKITRCQLGCF
ncbi:hypothetical protein [Calderihabitans maritimus]|uniref:Uncharacterized protein n=1 Tax=Calderihabitans maritimus TaxID=1246530 RepID=A0A1Z5HRP4_9FIRM|nr:hypothetical protein [Calderihabitans maritimus]GAW92184.1 hypothetical protein PTH_2618 [Calderihabitans maritimus]